MKSLHQLYLVLAIITVAALIVGGMLGSITYVDNQAKLNDTKIQSYHHTVTLYAGNGTEINHWEAKTSVNHLSGDTYTFIDKSTGKQIKISGTVIVQ